MTENNIDRGGRQLNFELLRIVAMIMIVTLHYLGKGGFLENPATVKMTSIGYAAWLIEAFCLVAVNVYVLIGGYFGVTSPNALKRAFKIWKQVIFYSVSIGVIAVLTGIAQFDIYQMFTYIFPIVTEHYWFATSYILLCLFMPFLNAGFESMDKKQARCVLGAMLLLFSVAKTLIPMQLPWDNSGYDVLWFVVLYLTGAYIRRYGVGKLSQKGIPIAVYVINTLVIYIGFMLIRFIYLKTGKFADFISYGYSYNYLFCYIGAIGLFLVFGNMRRDGLERFRKTIEILSGATFGVYLIHEHINLRYLWPVWFGTQKILESSVPVFVISMVGTVIIVYLVCSAVEIIRSKSNCSDRLTHLLRKP